MMLKYKRPAALLALFLFSITPAQSATRDELKTSLETFYALTKTGIDELRVVRPGTIVVIQAEGLTGNPSSEVTEMLTVVEEGAVRQQRGLMATMMAKQSTRVFNKGERVYVTRIVVGADNATLHITSVDTHEIAIKGSTKQVRYNGAVRFLFPAETFAAITAPELKAAIDPVLAVEAELANATPQTIELGQTPEEIESILGKPVRIVKAGDKLIYMYSDLKITFVDGKAADIQ
jgi:predicted ATPase